MKKKSIITMLCLIMGLGMATTSCEDMLSSDSERHSYEIAGDTLYSYWGILKSLQNIGERYVILGECRGDLIDGGEFTTDSVNAILTFGLNGDVENIKDGANRYLKVSDYYHVINSCNSYLHMADTVKTQPNGEKYMIREYAQVEAIRAWTYMQLVVNYGEVPFYLTPMTSTEDIQNFDLSNPENRVTAKTLWDKLNVKDPKTGKGRLERAFEIEEQWGYPQYAHYGFKVYVCHSAKVMFPVALVCADLLLMKAETKEDYAKAASYYYEFLDGKYGGTLPTAYTCTGFLSLGENTPDVTTTGYPWSETSAPSKSTESITAIASSTSSLWGTVQRGVNDLYGFDATIRMNTGSDSTTTASITLSQNWERQLGPSAGYDSLRLRQKYEIYVTSDYNNIDDESRTRLVVLDSVGDARGITSRVIGFGMPEGYICRFSSGDYYVDETKTERYIMKQNPYGAYSTVFPMVYRKSMVWLRFAEALNRAGFPGYAFAILKNGLVKNDDWLPTNTADFAIKTQRAHYVHRGTQFDQDGNVVLDENGQPKEILIVLPKDWETNQTCVITSKEYNEEAFKADSTEFAELLKREAGAHFDTIADPTQFITYSVEERANFQPENTSVICDYISKQEMEKSSGVIWLDFNKGQFSNVTSLPIDYISDFPLLDNTSPRYSFYPSSLSDNNYLTRGIHQKGCGRLKYNEKRSVYNFVRQINKKIYEKRFPERAKQEEYDPEKHGYMMTKEEIYNNIENTDVIEAIEDLILDEAGLELAFEGNRFFDLMRVANRRSNPAQYMINKIKARGKDAETWADRLTVKDWYLPLPKALPEIVEPNK
ncbi:MAG: RagB/SusD family nutrient uptake outer membrane protein [Lachnospiraceae bacterium]|nr:RagB/SusD family nutrient uptake outer membrane protein [Lachnospiraceae bacterium]